MSILIPTLRAVRRVYSRRLFECQELVVPIQMQAVRKETNVHSNNNHYPSLVQRAFAAFLALVHPSPSSSFTEVKMIFGEKCPTFVILNNRQEMLVNQI